MISSAANLLADVVVVTPLWMPDYGAAVAVPHTTQADQGASCLTKIITREHEGPAEHNPVRTASGLNKTCTTISTCKSDRWRSSI